MNIIKRMLRFGVAALAMAIGSQALAAPIISESFEGQANGTLVTNLTNWSSTGGDLSVITNMDYTGTYTATSLPLTNSVTHTNVAQLATESGMLSFMPPEAPDFGPIPVYVDAMVRFALSDGNLEDVITPPDTKIAIFANSSSNLVIRHGVSADVSSLTNSVTATVIDPAAWYRLTVKMTIAESGYVYANVQVNSNIVIHVDNAPGGLFCSALVADSDMSLEAVSFQGSGFIDDVVVTRDPPTFAVATASVFSYVIEESTNGVFVAYTTVTSPSAWSQEYAAARDTWYTNKLDASTAEIFALGADNRTVTAPVPDGNQSPTNGLKVLLDQAKTDGELPGQFANMSPTEIARIRACGNSPDVPFHTGDNSLAFEQAMKLNPYVNEAVTAQITSFTVGTLNSTIVVKALTNGVAYSASDLTVNVLIDAKASLTNEWLAAAGITNAVTAFNVRGESTNSFTTPNGTFFRARILPR